MNVLLAYVLGTAIAFTNIQTDQHDKFLAASNRESIWKTTDGQLVLLDLNGQRRTIFSDKSVITAVFLNSDRILLTRFKRKNIVIDRAGDIKYTLPSYLYADYIPDQTGTRFVVYERGRSISHQLSDGSYNKMRVAVFSTDHGEKLFEYKWSALKNEDVHGFGVRISDDGSKLYLERATGLTTFSLPPVQRH